MTLQTSTTSEHDAGLSSGELKFFSDLVRERIAVEIDDKEYLIESRLTPLLRKFDLRNTSELISRLRRGDADLEQASIEAMTTNETSFFRDKHPFEVLGEQVIPELLASHGDNAMLTIWNGACSSGQETYSLGMTIHDKFPELARPARTRIISTDVSPEMVERTRSGEYSRFEINRGMPSTHAMTYFDAVGRKWVAKKSLRDLVQTQELNLINDWSAIPRCDLVLMRNVLIYFSVDVKKDILRRIRTDVLRPGGCLLLGSSESTVGLDDGYEARRVVNSICFFPKG